MHTRIFEQPLRQHKRAHGYKLGLSYSMYIRYTRDIGCFHHDSSSSDLTSRESGKEQAEAAGRLPDESRGPSRLRQGGRALMG